MTTENIIKMKVCIPYLAKTWQIPLLLGMHVERSRINPEPKDSQMANETLGKVISHCTPPKEPTNSHIQISVDYHESLAVFHTHFMS